VCFGNFIPTFRHDLTLTSSDAKSSSLCCDVCKFYANQYFFSKFSLFTIQQLTKYYFVKKNYLSETVIFADDTNVVIAGRHLEHFCSVSNSVRSHVLKCLPANNLVINLVKKNVTKFITVNPSHTTLNIGYKEVYKQETINKIS